MNLIFTGLLASLLLLACNAQDTASSETAQPEQSITQAVHQPLDQAREVEQLLQDSAEQRKQQADGL